MIKYILISRICSWKTVCHLPMNRVEWNSKIQRTIHFNPKWALDVKLCSRHIVHLSELICKFSIWVGGSLCRLPQRCLNDPPNCSLQVVGISNKCSAVRLVLKTLLQIIIFFRNLRTLLFVSWVQYDSNMTYIKINNSLNIHRAFAFHGQCVFTLRIFWMKFHVFI